jgi:hypothetical protein
MNKLILFLIVFGLIFFIQINEVNAAWWSSQWQYRRNITINNTQNTNTLTDYQVAINLTYDSDIQPDFSDIRFTDSNDGLLSYWIESKVNSQWAYVWVKVPYIPASSTATIYVYYGNTTPVTSLSNGDNTFLLFDDFLGTSLNTTKWTVDQGTFAVSNGVLNHTTTDDARMHSAIFTDSGGNYRYKMRTKTSSGGIDNAIMSRWNSNGGFYLMNFGQLDLNIWKYTGSWTRLNQTSTPFSLNSWYTLEVTVYSPSNTFRVWNKNNTYTAFVYYSGDTTYTSGRFGIRLNGYPDLQVDWIFASKYTSPEPTYSIGAEEKSVQVYERSIGISFTLPVQFNRGTTSERYSSVSISTVTDFFRTVNYGRDIFTSISMLVEFYRKLMPDFCFDLGLKDYIFCVIGGKVYILPIVYK